MRKRHWEQNDGTYILSYGIGSQGGMEITEERYNAILSAVENMPSDTETISHRLKMDLTYEEIAVEPVVDDIDDAEALNIILGGTE